MSKKKSGQQVNIPHQLVVTNILTRLPAKSLLRFRCVCDLWRASMGDQSFVSAHLEASQAARPGSASVDKRKQKLLCMDTSGAVTTEMALPPRTGKLGGYYFTVLESCNGLLLVSTSTRILLCNPATRRTFILPEFTIKSPLSWARARRDTPINDNSICSLGFDPRSKRYKVLHMAEGHGAVWECELLTLDAAPSCRWRKIGRCPRPVEGPYSHAFLKGVLYWMGAPHEGNRTTEYVVSFDLREEKFGAIPLPKRLTAGDADSDMLNVAVLDGHLYVGECESCSPRGSNVLHLWMLVDPSKKKRAWYSEYIVAPFGIWERLLPVAVHGRELLLTGYERQARSYYYNLHDGTFRIIQVASPHSALSSIVDHVESLVWPFQLN